MMQKLSMAVVCAAIFLLASISSAQEDQPLTLEECVQIALQQNSTLLNSQRRYEIAGKDVVSARSDYLPTVNAFFSSGKVRAGDSVRDDDVPIGRAVDPATGDTVTIYERQTLVQPGYSENANAAQVSFNQLLFDFGGSWNRIKQAKAAKNSSYESYSAMKQSTVYLVHERYYNYLKELQLLAVYEDAAKSSDEQFKRTQTMYEIGSVAQGDVFKAKTTYGNDRINLITQKTMVANARALLNVALGRPANQHLEIVDVAKETEPVSMSLDQVIEVAVEQNPDLQSYRHEMRRADLGRKVAMTAYLPSFSVSGNYSRRNQDFDRVYGDFSRNWSTSFTLDVRWNLFNGFADKAAIERETISHDIAEEDYRDRLRNLRLEAEQALLELNGWREITAINQDNLTSAEEDLRLAQERYRVGAGTLLDIIDAQANLTRARSTYIRAKYDSIVAFAQLQAVMGSLQH